MGYRYISSGMSGTDILVVTEKGETEGHLPKGIVLLVGELYADPTCVEWLERLEESGKFFVSVAKHCYDENELTHISERGFVNRFGYFISAEDMFSKNHTDREIEKGWFRRKTVNNYKQFIEEYLS